MMVIFLILFESTKAETCICRFIGKYRLESTLSHQYTRTLFLDTMAAKFILTCYVPAL
jgi:hypothetical protein